LVIQFGRCKIELTETADFEHIKLQKLFDLNVLQATTPKKQLTTPNKAQSNSGSILKTKTNSSAIAANKNDSTKSVKFKLIKMLTNNEDIDENMDIGSSTSSIISTISSKSALNLPNRLKDLEKDDESMENAKNLKILVESDATSCLLKKNQSLCSINSTISAQSAANLCKRLNDLDADVKEMEELERNPKVCFDLDVAEVISPEEYKDVPCYSASMVPIISNNVTTQVRFDSQMTAKEFVPISC
jgi:hypothetical protein